MKLFLNILAISGSALFAGVLLAIGVLLGGHWKSLSAEAFLDSFIVYLPLIPRAIGVVGVVAILGLTGSVWLSWGEKEARTLWLLASASLAVLLIFTSVWFGPTNAQFAAKSLPLDQVTAKRDLWLMLHTVRIALAALSSVLGFLATNR
ncbi:anthrone oxygenase family protein [Spirosoma validum]|uniref:DUF1772 domain-containing protein n=1 Tax=Spirosoma validum TaxID=2771355 RepID=A0A927B8J5_9BACT|nr:anthrone oxygenase family protein [Spirosoma validum]MBD2757455.1 DUF1772 domain-containing protein [Spirosoma validum]